MAFVRKLKRKQRIQHYSLSLLKIHYDNTLMSNIINHTV